MPDIPIVDPASPPAPPPPSDSPAPPAPPAEPPKPADPPAAPPPPADVKEVKYDLRLPEGATTLDAGVLARTEAHARARGLAPEHAQAALDLVAQEVASHSTVASEAAIKAYQPGGAEYEKAVAEWKAESAADPTLGSTPEERLATVNRGKAVLQQYAAAHPDDAPKLNAFLTDGGLIEHPTFVRFMGWLGKATQEGKLVTANATTQAGTPGEREALQAMFPNSPELFANK